MIVGFTGTQLGMTDKQKKRFNDYLRHNLISCFAHGDCIGADADAHHSIIGRVLKIIIHPPTSSTKRAMCHLSTSENTEIIVRPAKDYIKRNHNIVDEVDLLIACPAEDTEQLRSGTWATIRYARKLDCPITIIFPDGKLSIG